MSKGCSMFVLNLENIPAYTASEVCILQFGVRSAYGSLGCCVIVHDNVVQGAEAFGCRMRSPIFLTRERNNHNFRFAAFDGAIAKKKSSSINSSTLSPFRAFVISCAEEAISHRNCAEDPQKEGHRATGSASCVRRSLCTNGKE